MGAIFLRLWSNDAVTHLTNPDGVDVVVIGGGVVGCAVAEALSRRSLSVFLLESERGLGLRGSSRNSGVVHSGLYYPPASLKAGSCVDGNQRLYAWCEQAGVAFRKTGKLVLARTVEELPHLQRLFDNAQASGAPGLSLVDGAAIARLEPQVHGLCALHCEQSGIVDAVGFTRSLASAAASRGAHVVVGARVLGAAPVGGDHLLDTTLGPLRAARIVNAGGFGAPAIAGFFGVHHWRHWACRGDYFRLRSSAAYRRLVYPVKVPGDPGLGIHLTLGLDGSARLGPDARYVDDADDVTPAEHLRSTFAAAASRLLGPVAAEDLIYDGCGVRSKLAGPGAADVDFVLHEEPAGVIHLVGIESPGLTASLSLAADVSQRV